MQQRPFASAIHPSHPGDEDDEWSDQGQPLHWADEGAGLFPSARVTLAMIAIGMALAVFWHYADPSRPVRPSWTADAAPSAQSPSRPGSEDQLARTIRELEALKKGINDLGASQQQLMARITALQEDQQELRQRLAAARIGPHWYSDPAALQLRFVTPQRTAAAAPVLRAPTLENADRRNDSGPLPLRAPRP